MRLIKETVRVAIAALMILLIDPWLSETANLNSVLSFVVSTIFSAVAVVAVSELLLSRPTILIEWLDSGTGQVIPGPVLDLKVVPSEPVIGYYQVNLKTEAPSWLARRLLRLVGRSASTCKVELSPAAAIRLTPENPAQSCTVSLDNLVFDLGLKRPGTWGWAELSVEQGAAPAVVEVHVNLDLVGSSKRSRVALWYFSRRAAVERIRLVRS